MLLNYSEENVFAHDLGLEIGSEFSPLGAKLSWNSFKYCPVLLREPFRGKSTLFSRCPGSTHKGAVWLVKVEAGIADSCALSLKGRATPQAPTPPRSPGPSTIKPR